MRAWSVILSFIWPQETKEAKCHAIPWEVHIPDQIGMPHLSLDLALRNLVRSGLATLTKALPLLLRCKHTRSGSSTSAAPRVRRCGLLFHHTRDEEAGEGRFMWNAKDVTFTQALSSTHFR